MKGRGEPESEDKENRPMEGEPLHKDLGAVETLIGNLQFTFVVSPEGDVPLRAR